MIVTLAGGARSAEESARLPQAAVKWGDFFFFIGFRQREKEWETDGDRVREECDRFSVTMCLTATSSVLFTQCLWWNHTHKREGGISCSGNSEWQHYSTERLSPETRVSGSDSLPHLTFSSLYIQWTSAAETNEKQKKLWHTTKQQWILQNKCFLYSHFY